MRILGLNSFNKDASAVLIEDNVVISKAEEERFERIKHFNGFPLNAIRHCLKVPMSEIDMVIGAGEQILTRKYPHLRKEIQTKGESLHHRTHAASAYRTSHFSKSNILTIDNEGDGDSAAFFIGDKDIEKVWSIPHLAISLGQIYEGFTELAGFGRFGDGKTMGLSSYGTSGKSHFLIKAHDKIDNRFPELFNKIDSKAKFDKTPSKKLMDLAASLQDDLEISVINLVTECYEKTGLKDFCFAGGVFFNSRLNGSISKLDFVRNMWIEPNSGDGGTALGFAAEEMHHNGISKVKSDIYSGPDFTDEDIRESLKGIPFTQVDPASLAAEMLSEDKIIGWFQGKMEWGPRALGNRSILANPQNKANIIRVNAIKTREAWRPLAPSILDEYGKKYLKYYRQSPFMQICFDVKEDRREEIPAIVHVDGSTRPQSVTDSNPLYRSMIKKFCRMTGIPLVMNTSFNRRDEPIVCTPSQAVATFRSSGLDALIIGDYLIERSDL